MERLTIMLASGLLLATAAVVIVLMPFAPHAAAAGPGLLIKKTPDAALLSQPIPSDALYLTGPTTKTLYEPGTIRVFTSEWRLAYVLANGWRGTALLDLEKWKHTPVAEYEHPVRYFRKAWAVAQQYQITLISSPGPSLVGHRHPDRYVAMLTRFTASVLAIQPQIWGIGGPNSGDGTFRWVVKHAVADNASREQVWGGISTCAGGFPRTSAQLLKSYQDTVTFGIGRIWLNVPEAKPAYDGSPGCPDGNPQPADDILSEFS